MLPLATHRGHRPQAKASLYPVGQGFQSQSQDLLYDCDGASVETPSSRSRRSTKPTNAGWDDEEMPKTTLRFGMRRRPATGDESSSTPKMKRFSSFGGSSSPGLRSEETFGNKKASEVIVGAEGVWDPDASSRPRSPVPNLSKKPRGAASRFFSRTKRPQTSDSASSVPKSILSERTAPSSYKGNASQASLASTASLESLRRDAALRGRMLRASTASQVAEGLKPPIMEKSLARSRTNVAARGLDTLVSPNYIQTSVDRSRQESYESEILPAEDFKVVVAPEFEEEMACRQATQNISRQAAVRVSTLPVVREIRNYCRAFEDILQGDDDAREFINSSLTLDAIEPSGKTETSDTSATACNSGGLSPALTDIGWRNPDPEDAADSHNVLTNSALGLRFSKDLRSPIAVPRSPSLPSWDDGPMPLRNGPLTSAIFSGEDWRSRECPSKTEHARKSRSPEKNANDGRSPTQGGREDESYEAENTVTQKRSRPYSTYNIPLHLPVIKSGDISQAASHEHIPETSCEEDQSESLAESCGRESLTKTMQRWSTLPRESPCGAAEVSSDQPSTLNATFDHDDAAESEVESDLESASVKIQVLQKRAITQRRGHTALKLDRTALSPLTPRKLAARSPATEYSNDSASLLNDHSLGDSTCNEKTTETPEKGGLIPQSHCISIAVAQICHLEVDNSLKVQWTLSESVDIIKEESVSFGGSSGRVAGATILSADTVEKIARAWLDKHNRDSQRSQESMLLPSDGRTTAALPDDLDAEETEDLRSELLEKRLTTLQKLTGSDCADPSSIPRSRSLSSLPAAGAPFT